MEVIMRSTLNVDSSLFFYLMQQCENIDITLSDFAKEIISYTINSFNSGEVKGLLTEYQDHNPDEWKNLDYNLNDEEARIFGNARLKYKISISKMLFVGFLLFGEIVLSKIKKRLMVEDEKEKPHSYEEVLLFYNYLVPYFKKRLNITQKE